jgi:hypothetical protein
MNASQGQTLIFLHIPKAAGTTLHRIIERQYDSKAVFSNPDVISAKLGERWKQVLAPQRWEIARDALESLSTVQKQELQVVKGHMSFGWHELLPQPCTYITILRDPIDLVISHYYYVLRQDGHHLRDEIVARNMSLGDYVSSGISLTVNNGQTRLVSGVNEDIGFGKCTSRTLEVAKNNLISHFSVVGLTEEFDKTLMLLKREFGWGMPFYVKQNVTRNRPSRNDVSFEDLRVVEKYNELDIELYEYAKANFEARLNQQSPAFNKELKKFRALNAVYARVLGIFPDCRRRLYRLRAR